MGITTMTTSTPTSVKPSASTMRRCWGHEDKFYNNKVVLTGVKFGSATCTGTGATQIHDNEYFTSTGAIEECGEDLSKWQAEGHDKGSTVAKTPSDADLIAWGKAKLYGALAEEEFMLI